MTNLYHTLTTSPAALPFRITLADGTTRTDSANQLAEGHLADADLANAGYIKTPAKPAPKAGKSVKWVAGKWAQVDLPPEPAPELPTLSPVEFMDLFTPQEEGAIRLLARSTDPAKAEAAVQMEMFLARIMASESIHLGDARVIHGAHALRAMDILATDERRDQVLGGTPPA